MAAESACPVCGAGLGTPRAACWLCRHPIPERILPAPAAPPPELPVSLGPAVEREREDRSELDKTSVCIAVGLGVATLGAFGVSGGGGTAIAIVSLLPVLYLGIDFVAQMGTDEDGVPTPPRPSTSPYVKAIKFLAIFLGVIILVPLAIGVALFLVCTVAILGTSLHR